MHRGRRGSLSLLCHWWSPVGGALQHQERGRPIGGMDPQKHSVEHLHGASKFSDRNWFPLEFQLGDRRGRWHLPAPLFPHRVLSFRGSTTLPPGILSPSLLSEGRAVDFEHSRCYVPLAVRTHGVRPLRFCKPDFGGSALPGGLPLHHPGSLPPVHVPCNASPPFLPSSVDLLSMLGPRESVLLVFWQFSWLFRQMWVESKQSG